MAKNDTTEQFLAENFDDFFERALCGYITVDHEGKIIRANAKIATWLNRSVKELAGERLSDILTIGSKIYYETHLWPLLRMQGFFDEVALELYTAVGDKLAVLANAYERKNEEGEVIFTRVTIFRATDRRQFEQNLQTAKRTAETALSREKEIAIFREQFIAVLGHDLRNPLTAILSGTDLLTHSLSGDMERNVVKIIKASASRMDELITNIMDFAHAHLGGGIVVNRKLIDLNVLLLEIIDELKVSFPGRLIDIDSTINQPVTCDAGRISQLFSNLLANALAHGTQDTPVVIRAYIRENNLYVTVSNKGKPIPPENIGKLFQPFTREETRPSQNNLGLGLYIASEISKSHQGELTVISTEDNTSFTFKMPV